MQRKQSATSSSCSVPIGAILRWHSWRSPTTIASSRSTRNEQRLKFYRQLSRELEEILMSDEQSTDEQPAEQNDQSTEQSDEGSSEKPTDESEQPTEQPDQSTDQTGEQAEAGSGSS